MTEEQAGRHLDEMIGLTPFKPKPAPALEPRKEFPSRALRSGPGTAPQIPAGPVD
jgi:hypothetical protein